MAEAKIAPNLPDFMVKHASRYLASGGTEGHMYTMTCRDGAKSQRQHCC